MKLMKNGVYALIDWEEYRDVLRKSCILTPNGRSVSLNKIIEIFREIKADRHKVYVLVKKNCNKKGYNKPF